MEAMFIHDLFYHFIVILSLMFRTLLHIKRMRQKECEPGETFNWFHTIHIQVHVHTTVMCVIIVHVNMLIHT